VKEQPDNGRGKRHWERFLVKKGSKGVGGGGVLQRREVGGETIGQTIVAAKKMGFQLIIMK